ncbi:MarR family winged helix-turn-helix transcriptional regulator [Rathayibacter soli]|uniref:MarR family winged helix-turn-helix transcriptional regulator n=1 Tax=Rathayibacter soli TaxID=3144168 RepID=UPI0027E5852C|nr:MarR family transcriptional regulator [Glaciibacter superstes]
MEPIFLDKLLLIVELFQRDMARAFEGTSLTQARVGVLWILQTRGSSTQQAIAQALDVSPRNISALVDVLEGAGYVQRAPHPTDRRAVLVELTPLAAGVMEKMQRDHAELSDTLLGAVMPGDVPALERGIDAIIAKLAALVSAAGGSENLHNPHV